MNTKDIDKRIGMPDIDTEWAKFEKEVIGTPKTAPRHTFFQSWTAKAAAIAGIIFLLGGVIASAVIMSESSSKLAITLSPDNDPINDIVEENPIYQGGPEELMRFYIKNFHYPQVAQDCGVQGRVIVQFVVEKDGRCTQFKILKPVHEHQKLIKRNVQATGEPKDRDFITMEEFEQAQKACNDEALRVCRLTSGNWTPGKMKGKGVRSRFTTPITFRLK